MRCDYCPGKVTGGRCNKCGYDYSDLLKRGGEYSKLPSKGKKSGPKSTRRRSK